MPVPGPRTQWAPDPGYRNPGGELPDRINRWHRPAPVADMGMTPGLMYVSLRGNILAHGQIRRLWRQLVNYIPAPAAYSWTASSPNPSEPGLSYPALGITRALRYMTRSIYARAGVDNTRFAGLHTQIIPQVRSMPVTLGAGLNRNRPTVRNRMSSFGSRVPPINQPVQGAESNG